MTRPQTISTNYNDHIDQNFINLGENVILGLTGNPNYPAPPQPLADLKAMLDQLGEAAKLMKTGLKAATLQRNYARQQAEALLVMLSNYATGVTPNRPDLWALANFPLTKGETTPRQLSQLVTGLVLTDGPSPRTLTARVDSQNGMYAYTWRVFRKGTSAEDLAEGFCYRLCVSRKPTVLIDNLTSGAAYGVECAAWNDTSPLQWSAPAFRIVQ